MRSDWSRPGRAARGRPCRCARRGGWPEPSAARHSGVAPVRSLAAERPCPNCSKFLNCLKVSDPRQVYPGTECAAQLLRHRRMDLAAVAHDVGLLDDELLEQRIDVVKPNVGDEAVDAGVDAGRRRAVYEALR